MGDIIFFTTNNLYLFKIKYLIPLRRHIGNIRDLNNRNSKPFHIIGIGTKCTRIQNKIKDYSRCIIDLVLGTFSQPYIYRY